MSQGVIRAGVSMLDITPPVGLQLGGFGLRQQPSVGISDALFAKALVLENDDVRVAVVSCDLLGFSNQYDEGLRKAIAGSGLVEAEKVMIACTHTHAGPATQFLRGCGQMDDEWMGVLQQRIVEVVAQAGKDLRLVSASFAYGEADLNYDRRIVCLDAHADHNTPGSRLDRDTRVSLVQFSSGSNVVANVLHYSCHPVVMLHGNRKISGDFCGQAAAYVDRETGAPTLFLNGACGNVNPIVEDRDRNNHEHVIQFGQTIARVAVGAVNNAVPINSCPLKATFSRVKVPAEVPSLAEIDQVARAYREKLRAQQLPAEEQRVCSIFLDWCEAAKTAVESRSFPGQIGVSLQVISIGELSLVGVGGELFASTGRVIRTMIGDPCLVVGYANGNIGYLPTAQAFKQGGYEVEEASKLYGLFGVGPAAEERLLNAVQQQAT